MFLRKTTGVMFALKPRLVQPQLSATQVRWLGGGRGQGRGGPNYKASLDSRRGGGGNRGGGGRRGGKLRTLAVFFLAGTGVYAYSTYSGDWLDAKKNERSQSKVVIPKAEIEPEPTAGNAVAPQDGDIRDIVSPQHRQVKNSLEHPGVYAWGSNTGRVVAPDSLDTTIKEPRRIKFFDGQLLRDLLLDQDIGVAVNEQGDVLQWGVGAWGKAAVSTAATKASRTTQTVTPPEPVVSLKGKNIVKVTLSNDRVIALSANGTVYSIPMSKAGLEEQQKTLDAADHDNRVAFPTSPLPSSSWFGGLFWSRGNSANTGAGVRTMTPTELGWGECVVDVRGGQEHCLLLTSKGRVFSAVSSFSSFPAKGQLGVPGLTWDTRARNRPLDAPYEVPSLRGITATQIAVGDYHSLVLTDDGSLYSFGDNSTGQLGIPASPAFPFTANPIKVPVDKLYEPVSDGTPLGNNNAAIQQAGRSGNSRPAVRVTSIAAGGATSFFTVDVRYPPSSANRSKQGLVTSDTWSCGSGIYGTLGTGKWVHISTTGPAKIRALSGLSEYDETAKTVVPIRLAHLEAGATHAMAVLQNKTNLAASTSASSLHGDTNWGSDTLWWGGNEYYQLGTGKRSNQSEPVHIAPLDAATVVSPLAGQQAPPPSQSVTTNLDLTRERLSLTPRTTVRLGGNGRKVNVEQRVTCGRYVSGVYSGAS